MTKYCSRCKQEKSLDDFYKSVRSKGGLTAHCKSCVYTPIRERQNESPKQRTLKWLKTRSADVEDPATKILIDAYHRERDWRKSKKQQGLCTRCGEKPLWSRASCVDCTLARATSETERRAAWVAKGLCRKCGQSPAEMPTPTCIVCREKARDKNIRQRRGLRDAVFKKYGKACACCGITGRAFLTIDHINEDGGKERRSGGGGEREGFLRKLLAADRLDIQILCWNCNLAKHHNGGTCPHEYERQKQRDAIDAAGLWQDWRALA